jgi:hypothetical protein
MNHRFKAGILIGISLIAIIAVMFIPPIPQDLKYHAFADDRTISSIPNFWNVLSNLPFILIGIIGMLFSRSSRPGFRLKELSINCFVFFLGIFLTGIGSAYYHLNPNNATLIWDRLPMTISFVAFFSIVIGDHIDLKSAGKILLPFLIIGSLSVEYWVMTENKGHGDLRFYALVQFLPVILIPTILFLFRSTYNLKLFFWTIILMYVFAKLFEAYDQEVFHSIKFISGHSIKHIFAALAPTLFLFAIKKQEL